MWNNGERYETSFKRWRGKRSGLRQVMDGGDKLGKMKEERRTKREKKLREAERNGCCG